MTPIYNPRYPVGTRVRVADRARLERFQLEWRLHNPLADEQLAYASREASVAQIGFYHGGDPLYVLADVPGVWHEAMIALCQPPELDDSSIPHELRTHLSSAYHAIVHRPYDPDRVAEAIRGLLEYLSSPEGRTDANCVTTDLFFCLQEDWADAWEDEPEWLADILADLGGALHDTFRHPDIAKNFDSTPEQLLARFYKAWPKQAT